MSNENTTQEAPAPLTPAIIEITIQGQTHTFNEDDFVIADPRTERPQVAAQMARWGQALSDALYEETQADSAYRHWKGQMLSEQLAADPKIAEWKAMAAVEGNPDFETHKSNIAEAQRNVQLCRAAFDSFKTKASMLEASLRRDADEQAFAGAIGTAENIDPDEDEIAQTEAAVKERLATAKAERLARAQQQAAETANNQPAKSVPEAPARKKGGK